MTTLAASVASSLYGSIVGETISSLKRAQRTARLIEEDLIAEGWPVGKRYGSEQEIAERFHIGRCAAREAIRILQLRGAVKMQRGPGGGMVVCAPAAEQVVRAASDYFVIAGVTLEQLLEARRILMCIAARLAALRYTELLPEQIRAAQATIALGATWQANVATLNIDVAGFADNAAIHLFVRCVEYLIRRLGGLELSTPQLEASLSAQRVECQKQSMHMLNAIVAGDAAAAVVAATASMHACEAAHGSQIASGVISRAATSLTQSPIGLTRAELVARDLAAEVRHGDGAEGKRLGSEFDLCERFGVSRFVMRQAIRMLEDSGIVTSQRGRGRGLVVRQPQSGSSIRLLCGHLMERSLTIRQNWEVSEQLNIELARLAALNVTAEDRLHLRRMIADVRRWNGPVEWLPHLDAECEAERIARNPVLGMFLRVTKAFGTWAGRNELGYPPNCVDAYPGKAIAVMQAIHDGEGDAAAEAEHTKQQFLLRQLWLVPLVETSAGSAVARTPQLNP